MKIRVFVYHCEDCIATFAAEEHEDLDHSDLVCPFCASGEEVIDITSCELEVPHEKR